MIDKPTVERITSAADVVEVVSDFITLKKKGTNYTACCPFHSEKTPSFIVSPAKGLYKCFGCGKGGGAVNFVMEHERLTYPEALRWLAKKYGIEIVEKEVTAQELARNNDRESMLVVNSWVASYFETQLHETEQGKAIGLSYFKERGFTEATIKGFGLGYCPETGAKDSMSRAAIKEGFQEEFLTKTGVTILREEDHSYYDRFAGRVIFPIHSLSGRVIGFGGRTMRSDKKVAKYLNSPQSEIYDKSHTLYGIFQAKKAITAENKCILVEGYTDVMQMHQSGVAHVVASSGTSLTVEQVRLIKRFTRNVTVIYDGDSAGIKASLRGIDIILAEGLAVRVVPLPEGEDPDSFARGRSSTELVRYIDEHEEDFLSFKTRILLADASDPIARTEVVGDIVRSIAVMDDPIAREVYINQCSRAMELSAEVLSRAVAEAMVRVQMASRPQNRPQPQPQSPPSDHPETGAVVQQPMQQRVDPLELELAGYLVKYGTERFLYNVSEEQQVELGVAELILGELAADGIVMEDLACGAVVAEAAEAFKRGELLNERHYTEHEQEVIRNFSAQVLMQEDAHKASTMWARYEIHVSTERERLGEAVPKAIVIYKTRVISRRVTDLQAQLVQDDMDAVDETLLEQIKSLNESRSAMNERYKRLT